MGSHQTASSARESSIFSILWRFEQILLSTPTSTSTVLSARGQRRSQHSPSRTGWTASRRSKNHSRRISPWNVAAFFEPAHRYRNRVSLSFEAIRALRGELDLLAQSVEPLKGLKDRIVEILDSIRAQLADLAMSVEAAKALRLQLSALVQALDAGTELEAQIHELSTVFAVFPAKTAKDKKEASEWTGAK